MDDNTLMKLSLSIVLVGLLALYFVAASMPYPEDIYSAEIGSKVSLKGKVVDVTEYDRTQVLLIEPSGKTKIVLFDRIDILPGESVEVIGKVDDYNGRREVVAEEVRKI